MPKIKMPNGTWSVNRTVAYLLISKDGKSKVLTLLNETSNGWSLIAAWNVKGIKDAINRAFANGCRSMVLYTTNSKMLKDARNRRRTPFQVGVGTCWFQLVLPTVQPIKEIADLHVRAIKEAQ